MSETPKTDKVYDAVCFFTDEEQAVEALADLRDLAKTLERENAALRKALSESDVIAEYSRADGQREWWSGGYWLHRDEVLVCMDRAAIDAARKEAQP